MRHDSPSIILMIIPPRMEKHLSTVTSPSLADKSISKHKVLIQGELSSVKSSTFQFTISWQIIKIQVGMFGPAVSGQDNHRVTVGIAKVEKL